MLLTFVGLGGYFLILRGLFHKCSHRRNAEVISVMYVQCVSPRGAIFATANSRFM